MSEFSGKERPVNLNFLSWNFVKWLGQNNINAASVNIVKANYLAVSELDDTEVWCFRLLLVPGLLLVFWLSNCFCC